MKSVLNVLFILALATPAWADDNFDMQCTGVKDSSVQFRVRTQTVESDWQIDLKIPQKTYIYKGGFVEIPGKTELEYQENSTHVSVEDLKHKVFTITVLGKNEIKGLEFYAYPSTVTYKANSAGFAANFQGRLTLGEAFPDETGRYKSPDLKVYCRVTYIHD